MAAEASEFLPESLISRFDKLINSEEANHCLFRLLNTISDSPELVLGPCIQDYNHVLSSLKPRFPIKRTRNFSYKPLSLRTFGHPRLLNFEVFHHSTRDFMLDINSCRNYPPIYSSWTMANITIALEVSMLSREIDMGLLGSIICF